MLKERLKKDLIEALKNKDEIRAATLRLLNSVIHNREIDMRGKSTGEEMSLNDEDMESILKTEAKKRKEAIDLYEKGGRPELAQREKAELSVIEGYLPEEMPDEELKALISGVISETRPEGPSDFGKVMGAVMKKVGGRADGNRVKDIIEQKLTG